jgi:trigger factor
MKIRLKNKEECRRIFEIEISQEDVGRARDDVYNSIGKTAKVPGFRPGKAPRDILEKKYSQDAEQEIIKHLIPEGYREALRTHKLMPVDAPKISGVRFEKGNLKFTLEVSVRPEIKLKAYKGIKVKRKKIFVKTDEVDQAISKLRQMRTKHKDVERPVRKGDYAVCDIEAFMDDRPITKANKNLWVMADKEASLLGIGEQLAGLSKGDRKELEVKLPDNYSDKKYAGKLAKFKVQVKEVKETQLPEVNDDFAKDLQKESLEDLKKEIESQLLLRKEDSQKINMKNQIITKLLEDCRCSVPPGLAAKEEEFLRKRLESELAAENIPKEKVEERKNQYEPKLKEAAVEKIKIYFILDEISKKENIGVTDQDVEDRLKNIALSMGRSEEEIRKYYEKENLNGGLREEIRESKTLEFLLKHAEIIDVA